MVTAESCTGGWVAKLLTDMPGSSAWFDRGYVTYSNTAKQDMLGVQATTLDEHGAVSEQTVREMVVGACQKANVEVGLAISGLAGPSGGTTFKPVGLVWFAWRVQQHIETDSAIFSGDRDAVRLQAVMKAIQHLVVLLHDVST